MTAPTIPLTPMELPQATGSAMAAAPENQCSSSSGALAGLQSYRYTTVFSFTGDANGKAESGSVEVHGAVVGSDRSEMTWKDLDTGEGFGVVRVGNEAWMQEGETWSSVPTMVADAMSRAVLAFSPCMSWSGLSQGILGTSVHVGTETINGITAEHYTTTYSGWSQLWNGKADDASGDVWIAATGYPVRYRFTAKGTDENGSKGSILWTMDLTDVNGAVTIEAPQVSGDSGD